MKKHVIISHKNLPIRFPFISTILYAFLLYYFKVSDIWWGVFITLYSIFWILALVGICYQERVDIFKSDDPNNKEGKQTTEKLSGFQEKLKQMAKERGYKL